MVQARVTIDTAPIYAAVVDAMNAAGHEWLTVVKKRAPVRKNTARRPGSRSQTHRVRLVGERGLTEAQRVLRRSLVGESPGTRAAIIGSRSGYNAARLAAGLFRYSEGPLKGQTPEVVLAKGSRVVGAQVVRGGGLRDSLELEPAKIEGQLVTIVLKATAPYAGPVEYGFKHKGGGEVGPHKRFMRGPRDDLIIPGLQQGLYFRRG